jgi:hypothetical protein
MGRTKKPDEFEAHIQRRHQRNQLAERICEDMPNVERIVIDLEFKDSDMTCDPSPESLTFGPESKATFEIGCPFHECIMGGFDFGSAIRACVDATQSESKGEITCDGWQDRERYQKHQCMLKANYTITVEYKDDT